MSDLERTTAETANVSAELKPETLAQEKIEPKTEEKAGETPSLEQLVDEKVGGLKSALEKERLERKRLAKLLEDQTKVKEEKLTMEQELEQLKNSFAKEKRRGEIFKMVRESGLASEYMGKLEEILLNEDLSDTDRISLFSEAINAAFKQGMQKAASQINISKPDSLETKQKDEGKVTLTLEQIEDAKRHGIPFTDYIKYILKK